MTLSSCKGKWIALSEALQEIIFILNLCDEMSIHVELPVTVRVDKVGAIFLTKNVTTSGNREHLDVRCKFVREHCKNETVKIIFIRSDNNDSEIMTKNVTAALFRETF